MDVVCERCQTEYEFDDALVSERGTTVKCTNCGHQFKIFRPVGEARAESRPFILRQADGTSVTFESLGVLQKWIVEGRANRHDQLSRDGATWKPLGSITELDTFFATAESARSLGRAPTISAPSANEAAAAYDQRGARGSQVGAPAGGPPPRGRAPSASNLPVARGEAPTQSVHARSVTMTGTGPGPNAPSAPSPAAGGSGTRRGMAQAPVAPPAAVGNGAAPPRSGGFSMGSEDIRNTPDKFDFGETTGILERWGEGKRGAAPAGVAPSPAGGSASQRDPNASQRTSAARAPADESFAPVVRPARSPVTGALMGIGIGLGVVAVAGLAGWKLGLFGTTTDTPAATAPALDRTDLAVARAEDQARPATRAAFEEARDQLTALLGNEPDEPRVHAARGAVLAVWGESVRQRAEDLEARAAAGVGDAATLRAQAAVQRQEAGASLERARQDVSKAEEGVARVPAGTARARYERALGEAARVLGDDAAARRHLDAARAAGGGPDVDLLAALLERDEDHTDAAIEHLRALHAQMATQVRARLALARLLAARGDADGARVEIEGLLRSEPSHEDAQAMLEAVTAGQPPFHANAVALVVRDGGAVPIAVATAPADAGASPSSPSSSSSSSPSRDYDSLIAEAQHAQERGQRDRARSAFTAALAVRPGSSDALLGLGFLELDAGNTSGAIARFRQVLASNPRFSDAHWGLADAYRRQGNLEGAIHAYRDYLAINPGGSRGRSARDHIDELEHRLHPEGAAAGSEPAPGSGSSAPTPAPTPSGSSGSGSGATGSGSENSGSGTQNSGSGSDHGGSGSGSSGSGSDHGGSGTGASGSGSDHGGSGSGSSGSGGSAGSGSSGSGGSGGGTEGSGSHGSPGGGAGAGSSETPGGT